MRKLSRKSSSPKNTTLTIHQNPDSAGPSQEDEDEEEMMAAMGSMFSRPRNLGDGVASGLKVAAAGVLGGVASLVAMPVMETVQGARESGAKGAAKGLAVGLGKGVATCAVGVVAGPVAGVVQIGRGAAHTPEAIAASSKGKQWDSEKRKWIDYSLPDEAAEVAAAEAEMAERKGGRGGAVADTSFYEMLGVAPEATESEIKKGYMKKARLMHPDKNPDDPEAKEKFQKLGEAYQVLSNADARAKYDARGKEGLDEMAFMDASQFYQMLFGSEEFDDFIGELQLAQVPRNSAAQFGRNSLMCNSLRRPVPNAQVISMAEGNEPSFKAMKHKQHKREVDCATKLAELLAPCLDDGFDEGAWEAKLKGQATELARTAFGEVLLHTIGKVYVAKAAVHGTAGPTKEYWQQKQRTWGNYLRAAKSGVKMYKAGKEAMKEGERIEKEAEKAAEGKEGDEAEAAKKEAAEAAMRASAAGQGKDMATFMEGAWHISVIDVESTLRTVCKKVLSDTSVPKEARLKRSAAMRRCGEIFLAAESPESVGADGKKKTLREQMEAFLGPMMGGMDGEMGAWAEGDEGDDDDDDDDLPAPAKAKVYSREALLLFSVKELRALMRERGLVAEGCLEKADFVDAVLAQQAGMAGATDGAAASSSSSSAPAAAPKPAPAPAPAAEDPLKFELEDSDGE